MKLTFVDRSGKGGGLNVAERIERLLSEAEILPRGRKIPRSTLNRLLSAEPFRNRVGLSVRRGKLEITHDKAAVLGALERIADDLAHGRIILTDVWDVDGKRAYLDSLETEGILPTASHAIVGSGKSIGADNNKKPKPTSKLSIGRRTARRNTLIPNLDYGLLWPGRLQRHHAIWEELQFNLDFDDHPNAISVLFRVLLELAVENYIDRKSLNSIKVENKLSIRILRVAEDLFEGEKIDKKYLGVFRKFQTLEPLISMDTLNRYVHSPNFIPSPEHLIALWDSLSEFIILCLGE